MSIEPVQRASPTKQERFAVVAGLLITAVAVVVLLRASTPREVVSSCLLVSVGTVLTLTRWQQRHRAVGVVRTLLAAVSLVLAVVRIAVF